MVVPIREGAKARRRLLLRTLHTAVLRVHNEDIWLHAAIFLFFPPHRFLYQSEEPSHQRRVEEAHNEQPDYHARRSTPNTAFAGKFHVKHLSVGLRSVPSTLVPNH